MKPEYVPQTQRQVLGYLIEECGETMAAVGKSLRWGLEGYNPELQESERETNRNWILRELRDLDRALRWAERMLLTPGDLGYPGVGSIEAARAEYRRLRDADDLGGENERWLLKLWPGAEYP